MGKTKGFFGRFFNINDFKNIDVSRGENMALSDWIDIFKGGKQKDSQGNEHNGDELIAKAIAGHKPTEHEVPICIGHPEHNAPAYGWVESLKETVRDGV